MALSESLNTSARLPGALFKFWEVLLMVQKSQTTTWDGAKTWANNGINYQPQLVIAGFLNHQQYSLQVSVRSASELIHWLGSTFGGGAAQSLSRPQRFCDLCLKSNRWQLVISRVVCFWRPCRLGRHVSVGLDWYMCAMNLVDSLLAYMVYSCN